ncbi:MAG: hypothetical protein WC846_00460 [Candidatus Gracilibacteria bacterium]|jgi:hypothetical protein
MFLELEERSLLIGRKPLGFTEHYYTEWDDGLGKERIALFLIISVDSTVAPSAEIAKESFQLLQDHFLDDLTGDPYDRFENALKEINHAVALREKDLDVKFLPNVHVIIGVLQKDMLFLSQRGDAQGYLIRKRHLSSITEGLFDEKNKEDLFQNIASGILEVGDNVILSTSSLMQYVKPSDLSKVFSEQSLEDGSAELKDMLKDEMEDQVAVMVFEVMEKDVSVVRAGCALGVARKETEEVFDEQGEKSRKNRMRLENALKTLRGFAERREGLKFLGTAADKIRNFDIFDRRKLLGGIVALVAIAVISIGGFWYFMGRQADLSALQAKLDTANADVSQAETRGTFDKAEASVLLNAAEKLAVEVLDSGELGGGASQTLDNIKEQRDYLDNVYRPGADLKEIADLSGSLNGEKILGVEKSGDKFLLFTQSKVFEVLTDQVSASKPLEASQIVVAARAFPDYNLTVLLSAGGKVMEYADGNVQFADTADTDWHSGVDSATYASKLYILDPSGSEVWKYQRGNRAYGVGQSYNVNDVDISGAVSIAVDGKVWLLMSNGSILQFYSGEAVDYTVKKAPLNGLTALTGGDKIYTELELNQVYVLDSAGGRILVFDKSTKTDDLTYDMQYVFNDLKGKITDFYVDKDLKTLMITTDSGFYQVGVK